MSVRRFSTMLDRDDQDMDDAEGSDFDSDSHDDGHHH
jgi:hypothetical protein